MRPWDIDDSAEVYGFSTWGKDLLRIADNGNLILQPKGADGPWVDLKQLVDDLGRRGISMPTLLRFPDLVTARVEALVGSFKRAIDEYEYNGRYRGVYPIKVNQQRHVVEDMVKSFARHHMGLEAGSKPELLIVMALLEDPEALIICNGYKDREYIETALMAQKLGRNVLLVMEKPGELGDILKAADKWGIRPRLGVRAKLTARGSGKWATSTGDRAKFGLTAEEIVSVIDRLASLDQLDCLELLHFHIGSQVTDIRSFKRALKEASRMYVEMKRAGAKMGLMDVGGGLAVDYDGSHTNFHSSANYDMQEYAYDVVSAVQSACGDEIPHPDIITEAGRALAAHHAILVTEVLGVHLHPGFNGMIEVSEDDPEVLKELSEIASNVTTKNLQEAWHDAVAAREDLLNRFELGLIDLRQRARGEHLFWRTCRSVEAKTRGLSYIPDELLPLKRALADTYFCNFSVFQSVPDSWAVGQLFPIAPIHRLNEEPSARAIVADLTCDSDGKIDKFIDLHDVKDALELHPVESGKPYYLAVFLVGAYQEILGDMHNLFGDTNAVHIRLGKGTYSLENVLEGDTVAEVLHYVQFEKQDLVQRLRRACEISLAEGRLSMEDSKLLLRLYNEGLEGYTYLEGD